MNTDIIVQGKQDVGTDKSAYGDKCSGSVRLREYHEAVTIEEGTEEIPRECFADCIGLKNIILPRSLRRIGSSAFARCTSLEEIAVPSGTAVIPFGCFSGCEGLKRIILPDTVTKIELCAFCGCTALEEIVIPEGVPEIPSYCFPDCVSLKRVYLPDSIARIGEWAFAGCTAMEEISIASRTYVNWNSLTAGTRVIRRR